MTLRERESVCVGVGGSRAGAETAGVGYSNQGGGRERERARFQENDMNIGERLSCRRGEEAIPELEIDVDELLDMPSDVERATRVKELVADCYKPTEDFVSDLLDKIRGMQKLSTPQKK
ncbi:protein phosphatase 1, regulatory (inhibitor) subunit 14Bb isoform X2 [Hippoglossus stenolepis]|uniref:protein phosphatase 1, regulatory (inhibitor) subunit 14Bb isoform X2 n=1 Tax=Hippoglossus stenolepis TaxID=195615 RepID=UPI00159C1064|nr:protein phosphatase 1, regulatory (inhibitor) subunit 14Bb isoform X2 [Hippoglossus stenolepis]